MPGREHFEQTTGRGDWDLLQPVTRASWEARARGERPFIPSDSSSKVNEEEPTERVDVPLPPPEVVARPAQPEQIPTGAARLAKSAAKLGWDVQVTYARGPWVLANGKTKLIDPNAQPGDSDDDEESAEDGVPAMCENIAVRCHKPGRVAVAIWWRKTWTRAGARGEFERAGGHIRPTYAGGGLHKAGPFGAYLKLEELPDESQ